MKGKILDCVIDLRKNSNTFGKSFQIVLSDKNCLSLYIPEGFAHGFLVLSDFAEVQYKTDNYWAKEYERNYKSGVIFRVDNTVGDNVEIMITDIKSYLIAMNYMNAFNDLNKLILFWDEPTITLDYESHECHDYISEIWKKNSSKITTQRYPSPNPDWPCTW